MGMWEIVVTFALRYILSFCSSTSCVHALERSISLQAHVIYKWNHVFVEELVFTLFCMYSISPNSNSCWWQTDKNMHREGLDCNLQRSFAWQLTELKNHCPRLLPSCLGMCVWDCENTRVQIPHVAWKEKKPRSYDFFFALNLIAMVTNLIYTSRVWKTGFFGFSFFLQWFLLCLYNVIISNFFLGVHL